MTNRLDDITEITERFISPIHYDGLVEYMCEEKLIVAFRPAGKFSLDKIRAGAAPKPHCILDKTIKPEEVGLAEENVILFSKRPIKDIDLKVRDFLCGLVGRRGGDGAVNGLYLTPEGREYFAGMRYDVHAVPGDDRYSYVSLGSFESLLALLSDMFKKEPPAARPQFRYFVSGDYDLHEIMQVESDYDEIAHLVADQSKELEILCGLSEAAMRGIKEPRGARAHIEGTAGAKRFVSEIYSPIQHGAQDNYIDHMFGQEPDARIVDKVAVPAFDIAFYNGIDKCWTTICNKPADTSESEFVKTADRSESEFVKTVVAQGKEIAKYLEVWGARPAPWWDLMEDENIAALVNTFGKTYYEVMYSYMFLD